MNRRRFIAGAFGVVAGLAGCSSLNQEEFEFTAAPGQFAADAVEETGYEKLEQQEIVEERTVDVGDQERDVTVTNYATPYKREVDLGGQSRTLGAALVFTSPSISFVGQEFNPVANWSLSKIVENARDQIESELEGSGFSDVSKSEERSATVLGEETTVGVFEAVTDVEGTEVTLRMPVTRVKHEGDFVVVAAAYPKQLADEERPRAERLFGNVEHNGDEE